MAISLLAVAAAVPQSASATVDLTAVKLRVLPEMKVRFVQDVEWERTRRNGNRRTRERGSTHHEIQLAVIRVDQSGNAHVRLSVERTWGESDTTENGRVNFDSADAEAPAEEFVSDEASGSAWELTLRPDGSFVEFDALMALQSEATLRGASDEIREELETRWNDVERVRQFALLVPRLPGRKMAAGTFYEDRTTSGFKDRSSLRLHRRNELARKSENEVVIKSSGRMKDLKAWRYATKKHGIPRSKNRLKSATYTGAYVIARSDGLPKTSVVTLTEELIRRAGGGREETRTETVTLKLRRVVAD